MTPDQFLSQVATRPLAPLYLFIGPESYQRDACRQAVIARALPAEEREAGVTRLDLEDSTLPNVLDDARALSLFAPNRVIWVSRAEGVLPRGNEQVKTPEELADYARNPTPGTTVIFDSARWDFEGDDKNKVERLRKFYAPVTTQVEFARWSPAQARKLAQDLARDYKVRIAPDELNMLVEAVGNSPSRVATELEKLRLYAGEGGAVTAEDIGKLAPQAQAATIFALVNALGRNDRRKALEMLDVLVREGEYLPLALSFLAGQFRQALVAQEAQLRSPGQIQSYFSRFGVPMWGSRAEQVAQTASGFKPAELRAALRRIARADAAMRDIRPDDRVVMEDLVVNLTRL